MELRQFSFVSLNETSDVVSDKAKNWTKNTKFL
jgi:hypothetical protein